MNGQESRIWARKMIKGHRGKLLMAHLISFSPALFVGTVQVLVWNRYKSLPLPLFWLTDLLCTFLSLGVTCLMVGFIQDRDPSLGRLLTPFQKKWWRKALGLALLLLAAEQLLSWYPNALIRQGMALMEEGSAWRTDRENWVEFFGVYLEGETLVRKGRLIGGVGSFLITPFHFFLSILLFLRPEEKLGGIVKEGLRAGGRYFFSFLGFQLMVALPFLGVSLVFLFLVSGYGWLVVLAAFFWWLPQLSLARCGYILEKTAGPPERT